MKKSIPTEIIQLFTSSEAKEYRLIPYELSSGKCLKCYGEYGIDYSNIVTEISVIYNYDIEIFTVDKKELEEGINRYYEQERSSQTFAVSNSNFVNILIEEAQINRASDIHFEPCEGHCRIRFRIDGRLIERYVIDKINYPAMVNKMKILSNLDISEKRLPQDGRILYEVDQEKFDLRVSVLPTIHGEKIVLRLLTRSVELLELEKLGFSDKQYDDYTQAITRTNGLILISGPTGSGKSTTLYATLRLLNNEKVNILTIEDPVEYTISGINQVQLKEDIGLTFGNALRTFLRQDPDIIMLGEIRDPDTAQMAIRSSLTGHLLLSTIHTNSAWGSVSRLTDMGIHPYLISDTLVACIAQRLVRLLCTHCKRKINLDRQFVDSLNLESTFVFQSTGCQHCFYTGYSGRKAIYEVIKIDSFLSEAIKQKKLNVKEYLEKKNVITLKDSAIYMLKKGETSLEEVLPIVNN